MMGTVVGDDRGPGEARVAGIHDENGDPLVTGRGGAAGQPYVVGRVRAGGEGLLPVDDVAVAVAYGPGTQRREVGAGLRLGIADGEVHLAGQDPGQEEVLLPGCAVLVQRGADGLQGDRGQRHVRAGRLVGEDLLLHLAEPAAAVAHRPAHPEPPVAAHPAYHVAVDGAVPLGEQLGALGGRHQPGEVGAQLAAQRELARGQVDEHASRSSR